MRYLFFLLVFTTSYSFAEKTQSTYSESDTVGVFAPVGYIGAYANTKTVTEAHKICLGSDSGAFISSNVNSNGYSSYKECMKNYVPFKINIIDTDNGCASTVVSWGNCSAPISSANGGSIFTIKNTKNTEDFEGVANFQCNNKKWEYQSGGCTRAAHQCEDGELVVWDVTSPLWADNSASTVYRDVYGNIRHTPKDACVAKMPLADSGKAQIVSPTIPEMINPTRYDMTGSKIGKRCFDAKWIDAPELIKKACNYIPKNCAAKVVSVNGCTFDLPQGDHNQMFTTKSPLPFASKGEVEAYCWDGEWEIKKQYCTPSCDGSLPAITWNGADPKACSSSGKVLSQRIAPNSSVILNNEVVGMQGTVTHICDNGTLRTKPDFCQPADCTEIKAETWGDQNCSHSGKVGLWKHGETYSVPRDNVDITISSEDPVYQCKYGVMELVNNPTCSLVDTICIDSGAVTPVVPPVDRCPDDGFINGGNCCFFDNEIGKVRCGPINNGGSGSGNSGGTTGYHWVMGGIRYLEDKITATLSERAYYNDGGTCDPSVEKYVFVYEEPAPKGKYMHSIFYCK